jgi:hypothetical protein
MTHRRAAKPGTACHLPFVPDIFAAMRDQSRGDYVAGLAGLFEKPTRAFRLLLVLCVALGCGAQFSATALAAGKAPVIVSMSAGVGGEVTVGADINPEGLETRYEIKLESDGQRGEGVLQAGYEGHEVRLTLTGLQPGTYSFSVRASNSEGETGPRSDTVEIPPVPPGACPDGCSDTKPYEPEVPQWVIDANNAQAAILVKEYEAKKAKEEEESKDKATLASEEEARKHSAEEQPAALQTTSTPVQACTVPSLTGRTLSVARRLLLKNHCLLGKVTRPDHNHSALIITRQSTQRGKKLPDAATVSVTLGPTHHRGA